nr:hypothetical protein Iba_chr02dCG6160 [Ipomoea batatas]
MQPFTDAHLNRSYAPRIGAALRPQQGEPPHEQEPVIQGGPDGPPEYAEYPPVYDWASMRAFQLQLHNQSMNAFNQRMDLHHEELMGQNEVIARQEERQEQQFQAIEQLRLWMEQRFPPSSQGGDASYSKRQGAQRHTNKQTRDIIDKTSWKMQSTVLDARRTRAASNRLWKHNVAETEKSFWTRVRPTNLNTPKVPNSQKMMNVCNLFSSPLSSIYGSPPPSPKGLPRAEMMVPRHTLERGEPSRMPNEDMSSEEGEAPNMEVAHRGLMVEVEDLFRYRHFRDK